MLDKIVAGLAGLAVLAVATTANATLITSDLDPALAGGTLIDFNATPTQNATSFTFGDVTFATTGGTLRVAPAGEGGGFGGSGQDLSTLDTTDPSSFSITFATTVSAFGMIWGAANPDWTVELFDGSNNLLETVTFIGHDGGSATFIEFYGATNSGIARADLVTVSGQDWVKIDDFVFVTDDVTDDGQRIPEPASLAIFGFGLLGFGLARRRRKTA